VKSARLSSSFRVSVPRSANPIALSTVGVRRGCAGPTEADHELEASGLGDPDERPHARHRVAGLEPRRTLRRATDASGPDPKGPGPSAVPISSRALRASDEASSGRPSGTCEVGESVGFCRSPGERAGWWPRPARGGSAADHLEGLLLSMQVGPPPSSRAAHSATERARRRRSRGSNTSSCQSLAVPFET